ncbi:PTS sugar transporter subunit IIB [Clostridiales bacterium COT073_COT-073]|nr:PTS sugar transporter subunit IIB [Clostridiales bacterium COT073_COT-073]
MTTRVLLCCGAGFSSGFLAQKARQAAKAQNLDMTIDARSESVISEYMDKMDVLLVGPHYESALPKFKSECEPLGIKVALIPTDIYSGLNGEKLVQLVQQLLNGKEN